MRPVVDIGERLESAVSGGSAAPSPVELLALSEEILEHWIVACGATPTLAQREGFRLLALHRQGADDRPSFNACRETCRELVYHYNLLTMSGDDRESERHARMMLLLANHLYLFVAGKLEVAGLGDFCCASRPVRSGTAEAT